MKKQCCSFNHTDRGLKTKSRRGRGKDGIIDNIECINTEYCAGYFYGLPEHHIKEVVIKNSRTLFKEDAGSGNPAMMSFAEICSKRGFVFNNVDKATIENVTMIGEDGELYSSINKDIQIDVK